MILDLDKEDRTFLIQTKHLLFMTDNTYVEDTIQCCLVFIGGVSLSVITREPDHMVAFKEMIYRETK